MLPTEQYNIFWTHCILVYSLRNRRAPKHHSSFFIYTNILRQNWLHVVNEYMNFKVSLRLFINQTSITTVNISLALISDMWNVLRVQNFVNESWKKTHHKIALVGCRRPSIPIPMQLTVVYRRKWRTGLSHKNTPKADWVNWVKVGQKGPSLHTMIQTNLPGQPRACLDGMIATGKTRFQVSEQQHFNKFPRNLCDWKTKACVIQDELGFRGQLYDW